MFFHDLSVEISSVFLCRGVFLFIFRNISVKGGFTLMFVGCFSYFHGLRYYLYYYSALTAPVTALTEPSLIVIS